MAIERCRIWWPRQELQLEHESSSASLVLFGWFFTSTGSLDIVISAAVPQDQILWSFAMLDTLQNIVLSSNKRMPLRLQESATFTVLGDSSLHHPAELEEQPPLDAQFVQKEHFWTSRNNITSGSVGNWDQHPNYNNRKWECDRCILDGFMETCRNTAVKENNWAHLFCKSGKSYKSDLNQVPVLHHLYLDGQKIEINHCRVILYDVPTIGRNHISLGADAPCKFQAFCKKPNWINDLQKKPSILDLDPIVLALNCSNASRLPVSQECPTSSSGAHFFFASVFDVLVQVMWHCVGILLASVSTILYTMILLFQKCLSHMSQYLMLRKVFRHSWDNIYLRSCQILYWPIILQDTSLSSTVNVEYAHKAAIQKHALWSTIVVDLMMGFVLGAVFLFNTAVFLFNTPRVESASGGG